MRNEKRRYRRVFSLVPEENVVLFGVESACHLRGALLDLSEGGALVCPSEPTVTYDVGSLYKLYFQSRGQMFYLEGTLVRRDMYCLAFQFSNLTPLDVAEIRAKLARMEILAARTYAG